mgnify:CR=1 FL=1
MAMPMQIGLEEIISMLLSRVEALSMNDENNKTKQNIISRVLYKKGILTDEDIIQSVKDEHSMLHELGLLQQMPDDEVISAIAESILQWIRGDVAAIKKNMEEYEKKMQEYAREEARKPSIQVAGSNVLQQLDRMAPPPGSGKSGSKLII